MLYLIGIGLGDEKDITVKGLEIVKRCSLVYLESYTSKLTGTDIVGISKFYGKKVEAADREFVENPTELLEEALKMDVALLVIGDPFGATTHISLILEARKKGVEVKIIHNASILNAIGEIGLELYKFGHTTSIPFENRNVKTPLEIFRKNYANGLHTLFLLDLEPKNEKYMTVGEAADYLLRNGIDGELLAVGCGGIGSSKPDVEACKLKNLKELKAFPQCLIIPAKLHFIEEEALENFINR